MPDIEDLQRKLDRLREMGDQAEQRLADADRMREQISAIEAKVTSADKAVTVTAGPGGSVTNIEFTKDATKLSPIQLSSTVMGTLRQAVAQAAREQAGIVQEFAPEGDVAERVRRTQEEMLGVSIDPGEAERPRPAPDEDEDDDGFEDGTFYGRR
ncbi:YbaB/EbfC family nucleoid-associated protein [Salinifilum ghardaiensis]